MSRTYLRILHPLNNRAPKFGHAYINKLQKVESKKSVQEIPRMQKEAGVTNV